MHLTVYSVIYINNIITDSSYIFLRKINVKPCQYDKIYIDEDLIEDKLYQLIVQLNERKKMVPESCIQHYLKINILFMIRMGEFVRY